MIKSTESGAAQRAPWACYVASLSLHFLFERWRWEQDLHPWIAVRTNWVGTCTGLSALPGIYIRVSCCYCRDEADRISDLFSIICSLCVVLKRLSDTEGKNQVQLSGLQSWVSVRYKYRRGCQQFSTRAGFLHPFITYSCISLAKWLNLWVCLLTCKMGIIVVPISSGFYENKWNNNSTSHIINLEWC